MTILNLQALLIWVHVVSTQFTMHLAKGLKNVVKKLNSSAWIFMHSLSTVQPNVKISEKFRLKWIADELLKDATSKLDSALASKPINTNSITAAKMMLETASVKREEAMDELDEIRKRRKSLDKSTHKLLDQALPSKETSKSKRKLVSEER